MRLELEKFNWFWRVWVKADNFLDVWWMEEEFVIKNLIFTFYIKIASHGRHIIFPLSYRNFKYQWSNYNYKLNI